MPQDFFVMVLGNTMESHQTFKDHLKRSQNLSEVYSVNECDVIIAFVPIVSRAGTDISAAMAQIPGGKPVVLVVLHHTFDHNYIPPDSKHCVNRKDVFAVDCLFHEDQGLLRCSRNGVAIKAIGKHLRHEGHSEQIADENQPVLKHPHNNPVSRTLETNWIRQEHSEQVADENQPLLRHPNDYTNRAAKTHWIRQDLSKVGRICKRLCCCCSPLDSYLD